MISLSTVRAFMNVLHASFLALFVVALCTVVARAACAGDDIRATIEAEEPGTLAEIAEEVAGVPNAKGKLWRVTAANGKVSHLFGTMHVSDQDIVKLSPEADVAHDAASTVVIEVAEMVDPVAMSAAVASRPDLLFFMDGSNLLDLLPDADEATVEAALLQRGMSLDAMKAYKPWMLMAQLSIPACATADPQGGLDVTLAREAQQRGAIVGGLETPSEQLGIIASMPTDMQISALVDAARLGEGVGDIYATMGALYREGELGAIWPTTNRAAEYLLGETMSEEDIAAMIELERELVVKRNYTMAERSEKFLNEGDAFIAVGALHLPGEEGLVELLRKRGYEVELVAM